MVRAKSTCLSGLVWAAVLTSSSVNAQDSKYQVTDAERHACEGDALRLCRDAYPDEDALLACMKLNLAKLTQPCRPVFIAGLRRRGLQ